MDAFDGLPGRDRAAREFTQYARNPARNVHIGGDCTVFAPAYGSPVIHNLDEGRRYARLDDFRNFVKLAYASPFIHHSGGTLCEPDDLPVNKRDLDMVYAHMRWSDKPFMGSVTHPDRARDTVELARHRSVQKTPRCLDRHAAPLAERPARPARVHEPDVHDAGGDPASRPACARTRPEAAGGTALRSRRRRSDAPRALAAAAAVPVALRAQAVKQPVYVGSRACAEGHEGKAAGNQYSHWLATSHSKAWASLATPEARAMARLSGIPDEPEKAPVCLGCHATAADAEKWEKDPGFRIEDGVQCEKCHGPGSEYMDKEVMRNPEAARRAGLRKFTKRD